MRLKQENSELTARLYSTGVYKNGVRGAKTIIDMNVEDEVSENNDSILEPAIDYALHHGYPQGLSKERKRAVRRRASTLEVDKGEVFFEKEREKSESCDSY